MEKVVKEQAMHLFCRSYCLHHNELPKSILEIGSRDGVDADILASYFEINPKNVFIVEPHPKHINIIKEWFPKANLYPYAISPEYGMVKFDAVENNSWDVCGQSSMLPRHENHPQEGENWIQVASITGKMLLGEIGLPEIDLIKIDVEGYTYEVLQSFGDDLKRLKFLHLEMENHEFWKGQKLYPEVASYLVKMGFEEVYNEQYKWDRQFDSFWKRK